jgi:molybdate transport system ATP-binding protein
VAKLVFDCNLNYANGFKLTARFETGAGVTALFGASGSGKSTIISVIAGTLRPQSGHIRLADRILLDTQTRTWVPPEYRRVAVVFQDHLLFPHLTIRQNLRFGAGRSSSQPMNFDRVVEILEIGDLLDRAPQTLSGGQCQRVALGRALLRGPELLLMDEPLTALDQGLKERILTYLERAIEQWHIPTLFVSHDQADVRRLAEHVIVLESGKVVSAGPTADTLDRAVLTKLEQRPAPVNLLQVVDLRQIDGHWEGTVGNQRLHIPGLPSHQIGASTFVQFYPRDVLLSTGPITGALSARNRLQGQVRELLVLPDKTFVTIDVGQFFWAEVTPEAARELGLRAGVSVTCLIKTSALQPIW